MLSAKRQCVTADRSWKRGFKTEDAARYIGRSVSWLQKRRLRGVDDPGDSGPKYRKSSSGYAIYLREDLDAWLEHLLPGNSSVAGSGSERECDSEEAGA